MSQSPQVGQSGNANELQQYVPTPSPSVYSLASCLIYIIFIIESSATVLKQYYEKALFTYDLFITGATVHPEVNVAYETPEQANNDTDSKEKEGNNEANDDETKSTETLAENVDPQNAELKKLQVFGAGPKMPGFISDEKIPKGKKCYHCSYPNLHSLPILTCKKCEKSYHKQCLFPPFNENPKGKARPIRSTFVLTALFTI